jgi:hypothetical protein
VFAGRDRLAKIPVRVVIVGATRSSPRRERS